MTYQVYSLRWLFAAILWNGLFTIEFTGTSYGVVNNVVTEFYNRTPYETDLLADSLLTASGAFVPVLVVIFRNKLGVRSLVVNGCLFMFLAMVFLNFGFISRVTYWLEFLGQMVLGVSGGIFQVLPLILATSWFPVSETATLVAIAWCADNFGLALSTAYFANVFGNVTENNVKFVSRDKVRIPFLTSFGTLCIICGALLVAAWKFATDHPPTPPSASQHNVHNQTTERHEMSTSDNLRTTLAIFKNWDFLLISISRSFGCTIHTTCAILASSIILKTFPERSDSFPGWLIIAGSCIAVGTTLLTGRLLDKYHLYKETCLIVLTGMSLCSIGICLTHHFKSEVGIIILYPLALGLRGSSNVSLTQLLLEVTYPTDNIILMACYNVLGLHFSMITYVSLGRMVLESYNEVMALVVPVVANSLSVVMVLFVKKKYERSEIEKWYISEDLKSIESSSERKNLISQ